MKKVILLGLMTIGMVTINAQAPIKQGETQLNAGFGLSNYGLPIYAGLEFGLQNNFSAGVDISHRSWNHYYRSNSIIGFAGFANYHFNKVFKMPSRWDLYAGLSLNYFIWSYYQESYGSPFWLGGQIGGRYFFNKHFGLNLEGGIGASISGGKLGITYKF